MGHIFWAKDHFVLCLWLMLACYCCFCVGNYYSTRPRRVNIRLVHEVPFWFASSRWQNCKFVRVLHRQFCGLVIFMGIVKQKHTALSYSFSLALIPCWTLSVLWHVQFSSTSSSLRHCVALVNTDHAIGYGGLQHLQRSTKIYGICITSKFKYKNLHSLLQDLGTFCEINVHLIMVFTHWTICFFQKGLAFLCYRCLEMK